MKPKILSALVITLLCIVSCKNIPEDGILPKDYSWAYGFWEVTEVDGSNVSHYYVYIGSNYIQIDEPYKRIVWPLIADDIFYPIYTFPKLEYSICNDFPQCDDELILHYAGAWDYEEFLYLNKKSRTVDKVGKSYSEELRERGISSPETAKKYMMKVDKNVVLEYHNAIASSPIWGEWKKQYTIWDSSYVGRRKQYSKEKVILSLSYQNMPNVILTKNGYTFDLEGKEYKFNPEGNTLEIKYGDTDGGVITEIYKKYY